MNFSKSVITFLTGFSWGFFVYNPMPVTASVFALCLLTFVATEIFDAHQRIAKFLSAQLEKAAERADKNEAAIKALVEAGLRMEAKINEMESKQTLDGVGRFAGLKR